MKLSQIAVLSFVFSSIFSAACDFGGTSAKPPEKTRTETKMTTETKTDISELKKHISLPFEPQSAVWQISSPTKNESGVPGPTDWQLHAILQFSEADAEKIVAAATKRQNPDSDAVFWEDWFPAELKKNIAPEKVSDRDVLNGLSYDAGDFHKSPLINGTLVRIGKTNYFFLSLFTT